MDDTRYISEWYSGKPSGNVKFPLKFVPHDSYYPLIGIPVLYLGEHNPYFHNIHIKRVDCRVNKLRIDSSGNSFIYRKGRSWSGPKLQIYSGYYSVIGSANNFEYMPSDLFGKKRTYRMKGEVDIFCLGVVKLSKLPNFKVNSRKSYYRYSSGQVMDLTLNLKDVTILVNEEKLRKTLFTKAVYTPTVRRTILDQIKREKSLQVKDVSDEYLRSFMQSPNTVRTNSFVEAMTIDQKIKDSVFSNLNSEFANVRQNENVDG
jgi:hypothetical protein